ncbi:hypothetical protein [Aureimonas ureilytica]|uniref:hypothetical protein n=1 Tax=Aureimonas ureilytica TaxID=401562 RepID=UPI00037E9198|nr:hypothetical protein [Aureimonas ureilytica]
MVGLEQFWFEASLVIAPAALIVAYLKFRIRVEDRRKRDLSIALTAMSAHRRAVDVVLDDPATPESMRTAIAIFSKVISTPSAARKLAQMVLRDDEAKVENPPEYLTTLKDDARRLMQSRPDLSDAFKEATTSGLIVAMLRDPATSKRFEEAISAIATDEKRSFKAVRASSSFAPMFPPGGHAAAC